MKQPEYRECPGVQENFERGMKALFKVPKADIVPRKKRTQHPKAASARKAKRSDKEEHSDVLADRTKGDLSRRRILDDLARTEYAEGVYNQVPDDFDRGQ